MEYVISVLRKKRNSDEQYVQSFNYESNNLDTSLLQVLTEINNQYNEDIAFEYSCSQKKCGACSAIINNHPKLLCQTRLKDYDNEIRIEPLRKFPVVCDLIVDRSILFENLKRLKLWLSEDANVSEKNNEQVYKSSECILCGLCLEVCPNFSVESIFYGPASISLTSKIVLEGDVETKNKLKKEYQEHIYNGCGRSLACVNVCPKKIRIDKLLVNLNGLSIWKKR